MKHSEKLQAIIDDLVPDMKDIVNTIESNPPLMQSITQNNYGAYMDALLRLNPQGDKVVKYVLSQALIIAGANKAGIASALKVIG